MPMGSNFPVASGASSSRSPPPRLLISLALFLALSGFVEGFGGFLSSFRGTSLSPGSTQAEIFLPCPDGCLCSIGDTDLRMDCYDAGLHEVPLNTSENVTLLDLGQNNISFLPDYAFERYEYLEELNLASNNIQNLSSLVFYGLKRLKVLSLQNNNLPGIPHSALEVLENLESLRLDSNVIVNVTPSCLQKLSRITKLWLRSNRLSRVPTEALYHLHRLEVLDLGGNNITEIEANAFKNLSNLGMLNLAHNGIKTVSENAFIGLEKLKILEINDNKLKKVPTAIKKLRSLEYIYFSKNAISYIDDDTFDNNANLAYAEFKENPIVDIGRFAFYNKTKLKKLLISEGKQLKMFPDLNGTESLDILRIDRAALTHVPSDLCHVLKVLRTLDLKKNHLTQIPNLAKCTALRSLHLSFNEIRSLEGAPFQHQHHLLDLELRDNMIESIPRDAFLGLSILETLDLRNNKIGWIDPEAFLPLKRLRDITLDENKFMSLPYKGLEKVERLSARKNKYMRDFPSPSAFHRIRSLSLSYAYHCCEFLPLMGAAVSHPVDNIDAVLWPPEDNIPDMTLWTSNNSDIWPGYDNLTKHFGEYVEKIWGNRDGPDYTYPSNLQQYVEDYFEENRNQHMAGVVFDGFKPAIHCDPLPGPFMPCEDLFDWWTLRCGIWIVFLLAMLGNGTVVFVLVFSRSKMDVPRFLVCNLAMADFFMGVYLGMLAVVDASTLGDFKKHAIRWQNSGGCQTAGFLGVLSSELSVYTLAVITLERNYAITHAMHLNKRLSLKHASYIMTCGWTFAIIVASLPLFGISDYRKFAICLPFETEDVWSLAYVVFLMSVNGFAFLILMGCYLKMYCAIRGSQAWNSNDSRIAKRMALLVFTDFICWAPIAFFSLTAAFGIHLISLEEAKVFAIFVLPLNSCANPFLYAILTKQFKKDCVLICKAIEESRVTRGIGRCRHSSNFSNRQTPANTNSVIDRNSSNNGQVCSCHLKSNDSSNAHIVNTKADGKSGKKSLRKTWRFSTVRYLLCDAGIERDHDDSVNEYAYALAEIQRCQAKKHKRNSSVSSENFSSSRSDSWRQKSVPLRLLESKRRRNSWTITRKPSQDSNLSNSRNDSSATTASTSTWRISRSSVSSDGGATRNARDKAPLPADVAVANAAAASGVRIRDRPSVVHSPPNRPPPGRTRPKLQRQIAISEDAWPARTLSIDVHSAGKAADDCMPIETSKETKGEKVVCFYNKLADIITEDSSSSSRSTEEPQPVPLSCNLTTRTRQPPTTTALSLSGFVPRKLSTISSRSGSMNHENSSSFSVTNPLSTEDSFAICPPQGQADAAAKCHNRSVSLLTLPTTSKFSPQRSASVDTIKNQNMRFSQRRDSLPITSVTQTDKIKLSRNGSNPDWRKTAQKSVPARQVCFSVEDSDDEVFSTGQVNIEIDSEENRLIPTESTKAIKKEESAASKNSKEEQPLLQENAYCSPDPT